MAKYRKKPIVVEAMQLTAETLEECLRFIGKENLLSETTGFEGRYYVTISTLKGDMPVWVNDWIIKGIKGEFYPCKPDIFEATYELVGEASNKGELNDIKTM